MSTNYKVQAIAELAAQIKAAGFRVFIAKSGTYGLYTDAQGSRVVSFQHDLGGFKFLGNYSPVDSRDGKYTGTGWVMGDTWNPSADGFRNMFESGAPRWATRGLEVRLSTLAQHLKTYQRSSRYAEVGVSAEALVHYRMTQDEARAAANSTGDFEGPLPLCGNGNFHANVTRETGKVNCPYCIASKGFRHV